MVIGSILGSTYRHYQAGPVVSSTSNRPTITQEEAQEVLHYAFAAPAVHNNEWNTWLAPSGYTHISPIDLPRWVLVDQMEARAFCFFDPETGLKAALFQKENQLLITFAALNGFESEVPQDQRKTYLYRVIQAGAYNLLWDKPRAFERALSLVENIKNLNQFSNFHIVLTGASFGGGVASYVSLKTNLHAFCFNSLPLGSWVQTDAGPQAMELSKRKITQITVETDWLSDNFLMRAFAVLSHHFPLPLVPGKRVFLPTAYQSNLFETHSYVVGSLLVFKGFNRSDLPEFIIPQLTR